MEKLIILPPEELREMIQEIIQPQAKNQSSKPESDEPHIVSQKELSKIIGVSYPTIIRLRKTGRIKGVQIGNKWKYNLHEVWESLSLEGGEK